ncbi:hypothetical protein FUSO6_03270 [Fusobacterium necrophorum DAB]|uniref:lipid II flippase MurJ n=1 Tax=Fusobacterium necrophorum TaxID=859 RepID=UPI0004613CD8|nr:lipid II flippase MurJ [Fusobacterium necrophorum]KDE70743.1 hypothetical protein FUSO6_03270 [Fusobacterium necrophorum DAB]
MQNIFYAAILITIANILSKILGFIKDILFSYYYGVSPMTDSFFLAMSIPTLIIGIFTSSVDSVIIPPYSRILKNYGKKEADSFFSEILKLVLTIAFIISISIYIFPNFFIYILAPGFSGIVKYHAEQKLRLFSFLGFFHVIYCFFSAYNTIYNKNFIRAFLLLLTNLVVIISLLAFPDKELQHLTISYLIGSILSALLSFYQAKKNNYKYSIVSYSTVQKKEIKNFIYLFIPIMCTALLTNSNLMIDKLLASKIGYGNVSFLNYASRITALFDSMLVMGIAIVILPLLSSVQLEGKMEKFKIYLSNIVKILVIFLLPLTIFIFISSKDIIKLIYLRGKFNIQTAKIVFRILQCYSFQILLIPLNTILTKAFHALENTKTPLTIDIITVLMNIILSIFLSLFLGVYGIAISTSIALFWGGIIRCVCIYSKIGWNKNIFGLRELKKIIMLNIIFSISLIILKRIDILFIGNFIIGGIFSFFIYFVLFYLLCKNDFYTLLSLLKKW